MTGGRDGVVTMWDPLFEQCLKAFKVEEASMNPGSVLLQNLPPVRALHTDEDKILIGTGNDEVCNTCTHLELHISADIAWLLHKVLQIYALHLR